MRDLFNNKERSFIVLLAIVLGVFGVSMMTTAYGLLSKNLTQNYLNTNPASFTIVTDSISDDLMQKAKSLPNMEDIEIRNKLIVRVTKGKNEYIPMWLYLVDDFKGIRINKFRLLSGNYPFSDNEILVEHTGNKLTDISLVKEYPVVIPGNGETMVKISGITHDPGMAPSWMEGLLYGYANREFVKKMNIKGLQPEIKFTIHHNRYDLAAIENQLKQTISFFEKNNIKIVRTEILTPGRHVHQSQMDSLMFLLQMFGMLALFLSCFLIINMIMAMMAKETRQIGVMKAIGAGTGKIASIYLIIVLFFGFVATLIALPIGYLTGKTYASFVATMLNFELFELRISHLSSILLIAFGTLLPVLVSFIPVYRVSRISIHEAFNDYGVKEVTPISWTGCSKTIHRISLSNSTLLAIRNTFRRKGRLMLTLITLVLGGAVFISAFNLRSSINQTVKNRFTNQRYDVQAYFAKGINENKFCSSINSLPFVDNYETWGFARVTRMVPNQTESEQIDLKITPLKTKLFAPEIINGQWLTGNPNEVVVNHMFLSKYPDASVGSSITFKINGKAHTFKIIGCIRELFSTSTAYINKSALEKCFGKNEDINSTLIAFKSDDDIEVNSYRLEQWLKDNHYPVSLIFRKDQFKSRVVDHLVVITTMLIMVTFLLILVGGLGLITSMGINIVERIREIAILRATGFTNKKLYGLISLEGLIIGLLSWILSILLSVPVSYFLGNKFFSIFFETTLNFSISYYGIILWFGIIVVFSMFAVLIPVRSTCKQSIGDGLSYE